MEDSGGSAPAPAGPPLWDDDHSDAAPAQALVPRREQLPDRRPAADPKLAVELDWTPPGDFAAYAADLRLDVEAVTKRFRTYWNRRGVRFTREQWAATWQTWCDDDRSAGRYLLPAAACAATADSLNIREDEE